MSSDEIAIRIQGVSKCFQIYSSPKDRLKQFLIPRLQGINNKPRKQYFKEFWALKDISLDVKKGETVGIIGRNGSGKSTLLQLICGTLAPTSGSIYTHGRVAALLELGSGFNPEFTGRENIYLNASILGLTQKEIDNRLDSIIEFADIGLFIDQPIKSYSSGMVVRLAFAVQAQIEPDILIVDEALSVGDAKFQAKCFDRLRQLKERGTCILLVTHSSEQIVTHCTRAVLLHDGTQIAQGEPRDISNRYMDLLFGKERKNITAEESLSKPSLTSLKESTNYELSSTDDMFSTRKGYNPHEYRWGDGSTSINDYYLSSDNESYPSTISTGQTLFLAIAIQFHRNLIRPILGITIKTKEGVTVYGVNTETLECNDFQKLGRAGTVIHTEAEFKCQLAPGDYFISLGMATREGEEVIPHDRRYDAIHIQVRPNDTFFGLTNLELKLTSKETS